MFELHKYQSRFVEIWVSFWEYISQCRDPSTQSHNFLCTTGNINQMHTHTYWYRHIHAYTCECIQYTCRYWHIACICMYLFVHVGIHMYYLVYDIIQQYITVLAGICMYWYVYKVSVGILLSVCIECIWRYCRYQHVILVYAGIVCIGRYKKYM